MKQILLMLLFAFSINAQNFMPHSIRNIESPNVEADFWAKWDSVNPRMTLFILVTPKSFWTGVSPVGFTSNTRDMTLPGHPGITFKSAPGITPTAVEQVLDEPANLELTALYQTGVFIREDVIAGKWNFATVEVFTACWENTDLGEFVHFKGNMGELKDYQTYFTAEGRGDLSRLSNDVNKVTQRLCRVKEFRDAECKHTAPTVEIDSVEYDIEVEVTPDGAFAPGDTFIILYGTGINHPENFFANGKMFFTSGNNNGLGREIAYSSAGDGTYITLQLKRPFPFGFVDGDATTLIAGCDRTLEKCRLYENAVNFRGEAFVPGIETANRVGSAN